MHCACIFTTLLVHFKPNMHILNRNRHTFNKMPYSLHYALYNTIISTIYTLSGNGPKAESFYTAFSSDILTEFTIAAEHGFVSNAAITCYLNEVEMWAICYNMIYLIVPGISSKK